MPDRATDYVAFFNEAVTSGDWQPWSDLLTDDAEMEFVGVPAGPYVGREEIVAVYRERPPDDTIVVDRTTSDGDLDSIDFSWSRGGPGILRLTWRCARLGRVVVVFG